MNEAFLTADKRTTRYSNSEEETKKLREREDRIIQAINSVIQ
jgi:hypothetical protein